MGNWIVNCNLKYYDVVGAFNELEEIDWKQSRNHKKVEVGDIVYIYITRPVTKIKYKCVVTAVNKDRITIDDAKYQVKGDVYKYYPRHMQLKLVDEIDSEDLSFGKLKEKGIKSIQWASRLGDEVAEYIDNVFKR